MSQNKEYIGLDLIKQYHIRTASNPFYSKGMLIGLPFNFEDIFYNIGKFIIPDELGIYHLFSDDELIYIGMSKNIRTRLIQHNRDKEIPFDNVLWFSASKMINGRNATLSEVLNFEKKLIRHFKPAFNLRHSNSNY